VVIGVPAMPPKRPERRISSEMAMCREGCRISVERSAGEWRTRPGCERTGGRRQRVNAGRRYVRRDMRGA
jgi:hypothetical protein